MGRVGERIVLDDINIFVPVIKKITYDINKSPFNISGKYFTVPESEDYQLFCPKCESNQRVDLRILFANNITGCLGKDITAKHLAPSFYKLTCRRCNSDFIAYIFMPNKKPILAITSLAYGGVSTKHSPDSIRTYLDEAYRCQSVGAHIASIMLYRSVLDIILRENGFTGSVLGRKIEDMVNKMKDNTAPEWTKDIDIEEFQKLNEVASATVHASEKLTADLDENSSAYAAILKHVIVNIIQIVYEKPGILAARKIELTKLSGKVNRLQTE